MKLYQLVKDGTITGERRRFAAPPVFPSDHPTKAGWAWLEVVSETVALGDGEVSTPPEIAIERGRIVERTGKRALTAEERAERTRGARDLAAELDALEARIAALEGANRARATPGR